MVKKIISFVLVALMVMCIVPGVAMAEEYVAEIGSNKYTSIQAAVDAAQNGDTVVVLKDHTIDCTEAKSPFNTGLSYYVLLLIENKSITIDLNGKDIKAEPNNDVVIFVAQNNGHLILKDSIGTGSVHVESAVETSMLMSCRYDDSTITVNGGSYRLNMGQVGKGMITAASSDIVTINGGTFILDNVGKKQNGSPWIFNVSGQNERHINVNGGTFNADILHQYYPFEVSAPKEKALKKNDDGTWTMVDAVAWVNEQEWSSAWYTNEVGYATLEEAIAAANKNTSNIGDDPGEVTNTVTLLQDCVVNDTLDIQADMTIALNGKEIIWKDIADKPLFDVDAGATLNVPNFTPRVYGYVPEDGESPASGDNITGDYNFKRKPGTYTVTWISEGVTVGTNTQTYGTNLSLPAEPTKASATFIGWFTEDGQQAVEGMDFPGEDTTYYARFKENPAPISSGSSGYSGPDVWYIGGNTFGVTTNQVPTSVEIDNVPVSFTMNGSQITVGCIQPGSDWVTVRWGSVSNQRSFTPDASAYCTQPVIPKTGDVSFWAAITEFLGF